MNANFTIKTLRNKTRAIDIQHFFTKEEVFEHEFHVSDVIQLKKQLENSILSYHSRYWYAVDSENKILGAIGVSEIGHMSQIFLLYFFGVRKEYRHHGIGSALFDEMEKFSRENGGKYVSIDIGPDAKRSEVEHFYEARGYKKVADEDFFSSLDYSIDYYKHL